MHMYWPKLDAMTPTVPKWHSPYADESDELEPLAWNTRCPYVTAGSLYGSPSDESVGLAGFGQTAEDAAERKRRGMLKFGLYAALAAGAIFLLTSDVMGMR